MLIEKVRCIAAVVVSRPALSRCVPTALAVGTLLSLINQGGVLIEGEATAATWVRIVFNYLIPFAVSNIGFVSATLARSRLSQLTPDVARARCAGVAAVEPAAAVERGLAP